MKNKKIITAFIVASLSSALFAGAPQVPPMPPAFTKAHKYPKSCESIPKMIVFLPPPMEREFIQCKNDLNMPTVAEATRFVMKHFGRNFSSLSVKLAEGFYQLYEVNFKLNGKNKKIYVNGQLTKYIDGN